MVEKKIRSMGPEQEKALEPKELEQEKAAAAGNEAGAGGVTEEELDADEREFRAMRRDLNGVKGVSAAGIVTISVGKTPDKNEFFRSTPSFGRSSRSSTTRPGWKSITSSSRRTWSPP